MGLNLRIIKDLLKERGMQKNAFAERIGMSRQNLDIIIKRNTTKHETVVKIAKELNVPVSTFYDDIEDDVKVDFIRNLKQAELENEIDFLKQQLKEKTEFIELLKQEIERLKGINQK